MGKHLIKLTTPKKHQPLGDNGIAIRKMKIHKMLIKTPVVDDSTHIVRLSINCYNQHIEVGDNGGKTEYFFTLFTGGCDGYITYINNDEHWDYISKNSKRETKLCIHMTIDDDDVVLSEPALIEIEIE